MVLSKNNTKGNEVLLQNIVLQKKKNHTEEKNGALSLHILKIILLYDFVQACSLSHF